MLFISVYHHNIYIHAFNPGMFVEHFKVTFCPPSPMMTMYALCMSEENGELGRDQYDIQLILLSVK